MDADAFGAPTRCSLTNMATGEQFDPQFNPSTLPEEITVNWNRAEVLGLSHQPLSYKHTSNLTLPGVEFYVNALSDGAPKNIQDFRYFMKAFTVPSANAAGVASTRPPSMIFSWPGVLSLVLVVTSLKFTYERIGKNGGLLVYRAKVDLERMLDKRITSEQVREGL